MAEANHFIPSQVVFPWGYSKRADAFQTVIFPWKQNAKVILKGAVNVQAFL